MPPFSTPNVVLSGLRERIESLIIQADRVYLGSSVGNLHIYSSSEESNELSLLEVHKAFVKRSIDQLGFIKDVNSLVVLSEMSVALYPLPSLSLPTVLPKAKAAFSFAIHSFVINADPSTIETTPKQAQLIPSIITILLIGCRRKAVIYSWKDGEPQEVREAPLPHSARSIVFLNDDTACFAYSPTEFAMFSLTTMTATDVSLPLPISTSGAAMNALSGLTGYMTLGLGAKAKPAVVPVAPSKVLLARDGQGFFIDAESKLSPQLIEWPAPPEEIAFVKPYIFSVLPAGTVSSNPSDLTPSFNQTASVEIRSSLSLQVSQFVSFPFNSFQSSNTVVLGTTGPAAPVPNAQIRLMTASAGAKAPLYVITTPVEKVVAANEGSSLWKFDMKPWTEQIDELVLKKMYADALALLDVLDVEQIPDQTQRRTRIRALNAVSQFRAAKYDDAINTFIDLDFNPAKVVALYPESVSGRLAVAPDAWITLYGGPTPVDDDPSPSPNPDSDQGHETAENEKDKDKGDETAKETVPSKVVGSTAALLDAIASGTGSVGGRLKKTGLAGLQAILPSGASKDDDLASITARKRPALHDDQHRSIETLVRYLADRRPKLGAALQKVDITPESQSHLASPLSEASIDELFSLPNAPLAVLTPEQLLRFAQIVDTALYKSYLIIRPALLGSLCRVANWCEVTEVEDDLRARKKFAELKDLYHGKKMHPKALDLLKELGQYESDMEDKLVPSIQYLQKLGPEHINQVFSYARWIFDMDSEMAFQIFTSEDVELPRGAVADYLEGISLQLCAKYLEFIIVERHEESPDFHDRLAELYLDMTLDDKKAGKESWKELYAKFLGFIFSDPKIQVDRLYSLTSGTDLHEARAILLGRLGRHDQALETYVYRLRDYQKAEEYCKHVHAPEKETSGIFLTLLRIYLRPTEQSSADLLRPALDLISRHSRRLDTVQVLQLLPPLVTMDDIQTFLSDALRAPVFDTRVTRNISKARNDQLSRRLMALQMKRVKVTDSRICPHCHKRIGNSVIAVHVPRGEVTHYQCREPFSKRLKELRR